jgi:predicted AAA+ superfamily ATPase
MKETKVMYDSFNARHLSHADVAHTFVSNSDFFSIAKNNHTVVLGPRGCGKTTMFKMLTTPALKNWIPKTIEEAKLKEGLPFVSIYIPSDELWKKQLDGFKESLSNNPDLFKAISSALITLNILSNFCKGIKEHIDFSFDKDLSKNLNFQEI